MWLQWAYQSQAQQCQEAEVQTDTDGHLHHKAGVGGDMWWHHQGDKGQFPNRDQG